MGQTSNIQWTDATWNIARGCTKVDEDCKYCLDGETDVLMSDFTWRKLKDIKVGDQLISVDENAQGKNRGRKYVNTVVEGVMKVKKEAFELITEDGIIVSSGDHPFLNIKSGKWVKPKYMRTSQTLLSFVGYYPNTSFYDSDYAKGYICGLTDGDGTFRYAKNWGSVWKKEAPQCYWRIALIDKEPLERCCKILSDISGIKLEITPFQKKKKEECHSDSFKIESRSAGVLDQLLDYFSFRSTDEYATGYLSGMFDAEGNMSKYKIKAGERTNAIRIAQTKDEIKIKKIAYCLKRLGFEYSFDGKVFTLQGGINDKVRFFQKTTPAILRKTSLQGTVFTGKRSLLKSIKEVGERELIDIQTSSRTFIANGFVTHNCYMYRDSFDSSRYNPLEVVRTKTVFNMPLKLKEPSKIFTSSLTDVFHPAIDSYRQEMWDIIRKCPQHTFQILTKRPERIAEHLPEDWDKGWDNVWLGTSVGSQKSVYRIDQLEKVISKTKFISFEPLHGEIRQGFVADVDWIIIGGESGNENGKYKYRPCQLEWIEYIVNAYRDPYQDCDTAIFIKQMGTYLAKQLNMSDRHGGNIDEFPQHLQIREFPSQGRN